MSRVMKKAKTEPREYQKCVELRCDICGKKAPRPKPDIIDGYGEGSWPKKLFDVECTGVFYRHGCNYSDSGSDKIEFFDICPSCFKDVLVPLLESKGAKKQVIERTW